MNSASQNLRLVIPKKCACKSDLTHLDGRCHSYADTSILMGGEPTPVCLECMSSCVLYDIPTVNEDIHARWAEMDNE